MPAGGAVPPDKKTDEASPSSPEQLDEEEREFQRLTRSIPNVKGAASAGIVSINVAKAPPKNAFFRDFFPSAAVHLITSGWLRSLIRRPFAGIAQAP